MKHILTQRPSLLVTPLIFICSILLVLFFSDKLYTNKVKDQIADRHARYIQGISGTYSYLPPSPQYQEALEYTKTKNVFFAGLIRNNGEVLETSLKLIDKLGGLFKSYKVSLFENDSSDNSVDILNTWTKNHPNKDNMFIISEVQRKRSAISSGGISVPRFRRMAELRNRYLNVYEEHGQDSDYLIMIDMDLYDVTLDAFLSSFMPENLAKNWSAVGCNGIYREGKYYDALAFRDEVFTDTRIRSQRFAAQVVYPPDGPWKKTNSMFGGIVVYRSDCFGKCRYDEQTKDCEHVDIYSCMKKNGSSCGRFMINPQFVVDYQNFVFP